MIEACMLKEFLPYFNFLSSCDGEGQHLEGEASDEDRRQQHLYCRGGDGDFRQLLNGLSSDDLNGLKRMFEHGKQQNSKTLEKAIEWSKEFQNLVSVKE